MQKRRARDLLMTDDLGNQFVEGRPCYRGQHIDKLVLGVGDHAGEKCDCGIAIQTDSDDHRVQLSVAVQDQFDRPELVVSRLACER